MKCTLLFAAIISSVVNFVTGAALEATSQTVKDKVFINNDNNVKNSDAYFKVQETTVRVDEKISPDVREFIAYEPDTESQQVNGSVTTTADTIFSPTGGGIKPEIQNALRKNVSLQKASENRYNSKSVYLEDVVFALKNQNWTEEEKPCLDATLHLLRSLQNFTLWAVWNWDSTSSQPLGLLFGNRFELGNFDECMEAPWRRTHPELKTQYCLADILLERTDHPVKRQNGEKIYSPYGSAVDFILRNKSSVYRALNELTWGACVPAACGPRSTERLMSTLLARSHLGVAGMRARINVSEPCQRPDQPRQYDGLFYAFWAVVALLLAVNLGCTYWNYRRPVGEDNFKDNVIKSFCINENAKILTKVKKEGSEILYGIRFLTMAFIVMDHQVGITNAGAVINGLQFDELTLSVAAMFVLHNDLFVDTFFLLSGLLIATAFMKINDKPAFNPFLIILKRYVRLSIGFAMVIFFYAALYPYLGSGPLWNKMAATETDPCRKNWWLNLLMLGNYVDSENICIISSWYIPCDFHYFVLTVLVFWIYQRWPRAGVVFAGLFTVAALITPGVITYVKNMSAIQLFTFEFLKNPRANDQFQIAYIKSHMRCSSYIIGLIAGCVYTNYKDSGNMKRITKKRAVLGVCAGVSIMLMVMLYGTTYLWRDYHPIEGALYASLNRPLWSFGVATVILCCCLGRVPFVEELLSWYPWVPLSRLAYGVYLIHTGIIFRNVSVIRTPQHAENFNQLTESLGVMVEGCMFAFVLWMFVEAPLNNLLTAIVKSSMKPQLAADETNLAQDKSTSTLVTTPSTSGHLHSNLPQTIEISSKM